MAFATDAINITNAAMIASLLAISAVSPNTEMQLLPEQIVAFFDRSVLYKYFMKKIELKNASTLTREV